MKSHCNYLVFRTTDHHKYDVSDHFGEEDSANSQLTLVDFTSVTLLLHEHPGDWYDKEAYNTFADRYLDHLATLKEAVMFFDLYAKTFHDQYDLANQSVITPALRR